MGFRSVFVLLLLLGAIVAGLYYTSDAREDGVVAPTDSVLGGRRLLAAQTIGLRFDPEQPKIEIERGAGGAFEIVEPLRDRASIAALENIALVYDGARMKLEYPQDDLTEDLLRQTGVEPGHGEFEAKWEDGRSVRIRFGDVGVFGNDRFVRVDGGAVYSVQASLLSAITMNISDYREPFVFANTLAQVARVQIDRRRTDGSREVLTLERGAQGFRLEQRPDYELDQGRASGIVEQLLALRADRFVSGRANLGPRVADLILEVQGMQGQERAEIYLDETGQLYGYATPRDIEFFADPGRYRAVLEAPLQALRSTWLFGEDLLETLALIAVDRPKLGGLVLERVQSGYRMTAPVEGATDPTPIAEMLAALRKLAVVDFVEDDAQDLGAYGLDRDFTTLRLHGDGPTKPKVELHFGKQREQVVFARRAGSPHVVAVPAESVEPLGRDWRDFVAREVMAIPGHIVISQIVVTEPDKTAVTYERDEQGDWRRNGESAVRDDVADVYDLTRKLVARQVLDASAPEVKARADTVPTRLGLLGVDGREHYALSVWADAESVWVRPADESLEKPSRLWYQLGRRDADDLRALLAAR